MPSSTQLDNGSRLHIVHRDVGRDGHGLVDIRTFTGVAFRTLDDLVVRDMLRPGASIFLRAAVRARQSILFAGAPGSGKTTLLSCCSAELDPWLRIVTEEVFEVDIPLPNAPGWPGARTTASAMEPRARDLCGEARHQAGPFAWTAASWHRSPTCVMVQASRPGG